jgi:hypothetical protein
MSAIPALASLLFSYYTDLIQSKETSNAGKQVAQLDTDA